MTINIKIPDPITIGSLNKDEKIVRIRASRRAAAHRRRVKSAEKKPDVDHLQRQLDVFENSIKDQDYESAGVYNKSGDIVFQKDGEKSKVAFTEEEKVKCKGCIMTHNHPMGLSFSGSDIRWACTGEMKEMRVISRRGGKKYNMTLKSGENFTQKLWDEKIEVSYSKADNEVHDKLTNAINDGIISIQEANDVHWDSVWKLVAKRVPELNYIGD